MTEHGQAAHAHGFTKKQEPWTDFAKDIGRISKTS